MKLGATFKKFLTPSLKKRVSPRNVAVLVASLFIIAAVLGAAFYAAKETKLLDQFFAPSYPEVAELSAKPMNYAGYAKYLKDLADAKGAVYAYTVALRTQFAPGTDLHLIGHVVGDALYMEKGLEGIKYCTPDFRNACSHSIVVGVLTEKGEGALPEIAEACKQAPGGRGAYTMCYHGLGHGVLAYLGYDLKKTVEMCKKMGTVEHRDREHIECVGGAIMEMNAGINDRAAWLTQVGNYFKEIDPLYPCDAPWMGDDVKGMCYTYLTPHLFESAGMSIGHPDPKFFARAFSYCDAIPASRAGDRSSCYAGFGKEFIAIAVGRDIRDVGSMPQEKLVEMRNWCNFANDEKGTAACSNSVLSSLFWGGENNPDAAFGFCAVAPDATQAACYSQLAGAIDYYVPKGTKGEALCARLPESNQASCSANLK